MGSARIAVTNFEMMKPLAIDLFCGLGGWTDGLMAEGYQVTGYDIEAHNYGDGKRYPGELVIRDVLTIHGREFKDADLIVASPPCQEFSYMAMPWSRAKAIAADYRIGKRDVKSLTALFDACFRIQREAIEAAGHFIPMIVENVRGAQPWVGKARWNFGSYYLWGDVPALMPITRPIRKSKVGSWDSARGNYNPDKSWDDTATKHGPSPGKIWKDRPPSVSAHREKSGFKTQGMNWSDRSIKGQDFTRIAGRQAESVKNKDSDGYERSHPQAFGWKAPRTTSRCSARKAASATIAKIPFALAVWIAKVFKPKPAQIIARAIREVI